MPKRGDKMYRIGSGTNESGTGNPHPNGADCCVLETVTFVEESLSDPSCTVTTYLMVGPGPRKFRCSKEMYVTTAKEAWEQHLKSCQESLPDNIKSVETAQQQLDWLKREISRVDELINMWQ